MELNYDIKDYSLTLGYFSGMHDVEFRNPSKTILEIPAGDLLGENYLRRISIAADASSALSGAILSMEKKDRFMIGNTPIDIPPAVLNHSAMESVNASFLAAKRVVGSSDLEKFSIEKDEVDMAVKVLSTLVDVIGAS